MGDLIEFKRNKVFSLRDAQQLLPIIQKITADAVEQVFGSRPELSATGGTSDARFIKDHCPVAEFGLVGQTMHKVDERVPVADLVALADVNTAILEAYFPE